MKTIRVGKWYEKMNEQEKLFIRTYGACSCGINHLRSFLSTAKKMFGAFEIKSLNIIEVNGKQYCYVGARKDFFLVD